MAEGDVDVLQPGGGPAAREREVAKAKLGLGVRGAERGEQLGALIVGGGPTNPISSSLLARDSERALSAAACSLATAARAFGRKASPAAVRLTPRAWRSSSATPSSDSSWRIACVSAGWAMWSLAAARVIWPSSATARK